MAESWNLLACICFLNGNLHAAYIPVQCLQSGPCCVVLWCVVLRCTVLGRVGLDRIGSGHVVLYFLCCISITAGFSSETFCTASFLIEIGWWMIIFFLCNQWWIMGCKWTRTLGGERSCHARTEHDNNSYYMGHLVPTWNL